MTEVLIYFYIFFVAHMLAHKNIYKIKLTHKSQLLLLLVLYIKLWLGEVPENFDQTLLYAKN